MTVYGPYSDTSVSSRDNDYKVFYHPYNNNALCYAISLPNNYDPDVEYPVMIWGGSNSAGKHYSQSAVDTGTTTTDNPYAGNGGYDSTWLTSYFNTHIVIVPRLNDTDDWISEQPLSSKTDGSNVAINGVVWKRHHAATKDLILRMINNSVTPYTVYNSSEKECSGAVGFAFPKIDTNRISVGGWSGGAITALGYLYSFRELIASAYIFAGQMYRAYASTLQPSDSYYSWWNVEHMKVLAKNIAGLPCFISVANTGMQHDIIALATEVDSVCTEFGIDNKFWFVGHDSTTHSIPVEMANCFDSGKKIDTTIHSRQLWNTNPDSSTNLNPIQWMSQFTKEDSEYAPITQEEKDFISGKSYYATVYSFINTPLTNLEFLIDDTTYYTRLDKRIVVSTQNFTKYNCDLKIDGALLADFDGNTVLDLRGKQTDKEVEYLGVLLSPDYNDRLKIRQETYYLTEGTII